MIPTRPMTASEWAYASWGHNQGFALTVPAASLQMLLDRIVELEGVRLAMEQNLKVTVETQGRPVSP